MKPRQAITQERLKQVMQYDPDAGLMLRISGQDAGAYCAARSDDGYVIASVDGVTPELYSQSQTF